MLVSPNANIYVSFMPGLVKIIPERQPWQGSWHPWHGSRQIWQGSITEENKMTSDLTEIHEKMTDR